MTDDAHGRSHSIRHTYSKIVRYVLTELCTKKFVIFLGGDVELCIILKIGTYFLKKVL